MGRAVLARTSDRASGRVGRACEVVGFPRSEVQRIAAAAPTSVVRLEAAERRGDVQALFEIEQVLRDELYGGQEWLERAARAGDEDAAQILASAPPAARRPTGVNFGDPRASSQVRWPE